MVHPMKKTIAYTNICLLLLLFGILNAQNDKSKIVGIWEFQTITSIYYSDPQETSSTSRDENHQETLTFREDGSFSYHGVDEGSKYASIIGSWNIEKTTLIMDVSTNTKQIRVLNAQKETDITFLNLIWNYSKINRTR